MPVPPLREIRSLPVASEPDATSRGRRAGWSAARGAVFVAGLLLVAVGALVQWRVGPERARLNINRPVIEEVTIDDVQRLTPREAWEAWVRFRDQKLEFRPTPKYLENRSQYREYSYYLYAGWAAAAAGVIAILVSLVARF